MEAAKGAPYQQALRGNTPDEYVLNYVENALGTFEDGAELVPSTPGTEKSLEMHRITPLPAKDMVKKCSKMSFPS